LKIKQASASSIATKNFIDLNLRVLCFGYQASPPLLRSKKGRNEERKEGMKEGRKEERKEGRSR
jgi:hypothetical protein